MKRIVLLVMATLLGGLMWMGQLGFTSSLEPRERIRSLVLTKLDSCLEDLSLLAASPELQAAQIKYHEARRHYKAVQFFIEHFSSKTVKLYINGPLVPKHDEENGLTVREPNGFQQLEVLLFSGDSINLASIKEEVKWLKNQLSKQQGYFKTVRFTDAQIFDMVQLELYRMVSLNLTGFDATLTQVNVSEALHSLRSLREVLGGYEDAQPVIRLIDKAIRYMERQLSFAEFNRLDFITDHILPIHRSINAFRNQKGLAYTRLKHAVRLQENDLFSAKALNRRYFSMYYADTARLEEQAVLGRMLFFDPLLSGNGQRSCASCHKPNRAFAESLTSSSHFNPQLQVNRNAPVLQNAIFQRAFFYDGRAKNFEEQAFVVIHNPNEMHGDLAEVGAKLNQSPEYRELFKKAFGEKATQINGYGIQKALAEYQRSLVGMDSRFDQYLAGKRSALSSDEKNGANLFMGKALCATCHFFPVFNGTVPPFFDDSEYEIIGTPSTAKNTSVSSDSGRFAVTRLPMHLRSMKTPTVRNISKSAPYMHNGVYNTLDEVLTFYHKGGGQGLGYEVEGQTLPFDSLPLNQTEIKQLKAFLLCLDDKVVFQAPKRLPQFPGDHAWNQRLVGGVY
ncbi:MAG TPA: cytochrome c peroxidase [Luteibaculaceae bacterium]|nr:cytochrome c peroxidase [Luteibaculaceae bacterium]